VDTNILLLSKEINLQKTLACVVKEKVLNNLSVFVRQTAIEINFSTCENWVILNPIEQRIKNKIDAIGIPLKKWDINIYRGILTGYNEAFIIDVNKRNELIAEDPKSAEIIRPILRGRDIKRYSYEFPDLWLLFIPWHFPLHNDSSITGASEKAEKAFESQYQAVYNHLVQYKTELSNRNKAETGIRYEWYALQRWGANYWEDFSKQKLLWAETMRIHKENAKNFPRFGFESNGQFFTDKTCFFATGSQLKFILGILNSNLGRYLCSQYVSILDDGGYLMQKVYLEKIPIAPYSIVLEKLVEIIEKPGIENQINNLVYQFYKLGRDEIDFIETLQSQPLQR